MTVVPGRWILIQTPVLPFYAALSCFQGAYGQAILLPVGASIPLGTWRAAAAWQCIAAPRSSSSKRKHTTAWQGSFLPTQARDHSTRSRQQQEPALPASRQQPRQAAASISSGPNAWPTTVKRAQQLDRGGGAAAASIGVGCAESTDGCAAAGASHDAAVWVQHDDQQVC